MANRVINTILNLRDNMSGGLIRAARNTAGVTSFPFLSASTSLLLSFPTPVTVSP